MAICKNDSFCCKMLLALTFVISVMSAFAATPQVKNVRAFQQYPWGKVYISYEVEGNIVASGGIGPTPILVATARDNVSGKTYRSALTHLSGDTGKEVGLHRVIWDVGTQGISLNSANVTITVEYCDGEYLVVDLSAGVNASSYPISCLDTVPSGGWSSDYKTTKLVLRRITAGTYSMQNTSNVTLTKPFYMGVFEVTQKQWELVTGSNPCSSTDYGKGDSYPVHFVSYNMIRGSSNGAKWPSSSAVDSSSFMGKLRKRTGINFDLPTEAQWEYACRAGTATTYYWGDYMNDNYAWYLANSSNKSHPVGTKTPNAWGLYDMSGNVEENCLDWFGDMSYGIDPRGPSSGKTGEYRVMRGGDMSDGKDYCTSFKRSLTGPETTAKSRGFRLSWTLQ